MQDESRLAELLRHLGREDGVAAQLVRRLAGRVAAEEVEPWAYGDFVVRITADGAGGGLTARLEVSPSGASGQAPLDLSKCSASTSFAHVLGDRRVTARDVRRTTPVEEEPFCPQAFGQCLSDALFTGRLRDAWMADLGRVQGGARTGLRLRLLFDLHHPSVAPVAALPWELILDPFTDAPAPLCLDPRTPLVRTVPARVQAPRHTGPSNVLLVRSQPPDQEALKLEREKQLIADSWERVPGVRVGDGVGRLEDLRRLLEGTGARVLHFMGHGDFNARSGVGVLLFENGGDGSFEVSARSLTEQLNGFDLSLVVLASCRSGELPRRGGVSPFASLATALVRGGRPAVLAMQYPISDPGAVRFSDRLYRGLAAGERLETAVTEARLRLLACFPDSLEWITPVLYLAGDIELGSTPRSRP